MILSIFTWFIYNKFFVVKLILLKFFTWCWIITYPVWQNQNLQRNNKLCYNILYLGQQFFPDKTLKSSHWDMSILFCSLCTKIPSTFLWFMPFKDICLYGYITDSLWAMMWKCDNLWSVDNSTMYTETGLHTWWLWIFQYKVKDCISHTLKYSRDEQSL